MDYRECACEFLVPEGYRCPYCNDMAAEEIDAMPILKPLKDGLHRERVARERKARRARRLGAWLRPLTLLRSVRSGR